MTGEIIVYLVLGALLVVAGGILLLFLRVPKTSAKDLGFIGALALIAGLALLTTAIAFDLPGLKGEPSLDIEPGSYNIVALIETQNNDGDEVIDLLLNVSGEGEETTHHRYYRFETTGLRGDIPSGDISDYQLTIIDEGGWRFYQIEPPSW